MTKTKPDPVTRIQALARSFPALSGAPGVILPGIDPWDPDRLDAWAGEMVAHQAWGRRSAALFILSVWDNDQTWASGRFDPVWAMGKWADGDRAAFAAWAAAPWWSDGGNAVRRPRRDSREGRERFGRAGSGTKTP
ncbi:MAG: hypothetical protein K2X82_02005 [Gemmataceae bacterium]|nr:hypothetical protein [Gemmataceae bacterium]